MRYCFYRADRLARPKTLGLPVLPLSPRDGWYDDPQSEFYNQGVRLPFSGRAERLWRADPIYDLIVVIGYNDAPVIAHSGSAIFLHVARHNLAPTDGCIATAKPHLLSILKSARADTHITIMG